MAIDGAEVMSLTITIPLTDANVWGGLRGAD